MAKSSVRVRNKYYIRARSAVSDDRTLVLKHGDTFAVFDRYGDMQPYGLEGPHGLYHGDTRYLSHSVLRLKTGPLLLLSSAVSRDNSVITVDLTNPDIQKDDESVVPRGTLHIARTKFIWENTCFERVRVANFSAAPVRVLLEASFDSDFADIFEVRGTPRKRRGRRNLPQTTADGLLLSYRGLDGVTRRTCVHWNPPPRSLQGFVAEFELQLAPGEPATLEFSMACENGDGARSAASAVDLRTALAQQAAQSTVESSDEAYVRTSNEQFNDWLHRSIADLRMMTTETPSGPFPYAGVPWFSTAFGRDAILTALESIWINATWARGVLSFLADTQATEVDARSDAEPGKILHEARQGEMAVLGEVPFRRYYGSVDSTPLFIVLAAAYLRWTGDREFVAAIWPNIERALDWISRHGDADGDGFVEYARKSSTGLAQQGWKDSHDSVFHADGSAAEWPIALCEVQAYVYSAKRGAARIAEMLGHTEEATRLRAQAAQLRERFEGAFWNDALQTYALALDGAKRPCLVRTSNAGHALFGGIAAEGRSAAVVNHLLSQEGYSGWGIRTVAAGQRRYNPMSYHNGSVWPHDNALIADGMSRYGHKDAAMRILTGMFDASTYMHLHRMPELFCGFHRRPGAGPTAYPVACSPQSWAAGAVFMLLRSVLGLNADAARQQLRLHRPALPAWLKHMEIRNLRVGGARVDLAIQRYAADDVGIHVLRREGQVEIISHA